MSSIQLADSSAAAARFPAPRVPPYRLPGYGLIILGVGLNVPFAILGSTFDYPDILRQPTADVLIRLQAGGTALIATWYSFMAAALLFIPPMIRA